MPCGVHDLWRWVPSDSLPRLRDPEMISFSSFDQRLSVRATLHPSMRVARVPGPPSTSRVSVSDRSQHSLDDPWQPWGYSVVPALACDGEFVP